MKRLTYILSIHLGKRDVSVNGLPKNQFQVIHWWRSGGEMLGAEEVVAGPLRIYLQLEKVSTFELSRLQWMGKFQSLVGSPC